MTKAGRFFIQLDVNWYDEWGHAVSVNAALLWLLALGQSKRIGSPTLTLAQLRRVAPATMTSIDYSNAVAELIGCDIAPISGDDRAIVLHGFDDWNANSASKSGVYGNHIRWHVNTGEPDLTCGYCSDRPDSPPISPPDRYREEKRREEKSISHTPETTRKTGVPKTFPITPHLREWATNNDLTTLNLETATQEFLDYHAARGSKMADWDRAWMTWIRKGNGWAKEKIQPKTGDGWAVARGADPLPLEDDYGEPVVLPGVASG